MLVIKDNIEIKDKNKIIIKNKIWIENKILYLKDGENYYKLENNKWYYKTPLTRGEYIFSGYGATPIYNLDNEIERTEDLLTIFEEKE